MSEEERVAQLQVGPFGHAMVPPPTPSPPEYASPHVSCRRAHTASLSRVCAWSISVDILVCVALSLYMCGMARSPRGFSPSLIAAYTLTPIHMYTCTLIHTHVSIPTYLCTHTCMHARMHAYIHTYIHTHIHAYIHTCIHACIHACVHTHMHIYIPAYLHSCMHAYIRTHLHICMRTHIHA